MEDNAFRAIVRATQNGVSIHTNVNTLEPGRFDFNIYQGQSLSVRITWSDDEEEIKDLSAWTARLKIKQTLTGTALVSLTSTATEGITLAATAPNITIYRTAALTAAYTGWLRALYDLELVDASGNVTRLLEGTVTLRKEVTA